MTRVLGTDYREVDIKMCLSVTSPCFEISKVLKKAFSAVYSILLNKIYILQIICGWNDVRDQ